MQVERVEKEYPGFIVKNNIGDTQNIPMTLLLNEKGKGSMDISGMTLDVSYQNGRITAVAVLDAQLTVAVDAELIKEKESLRFNGTWKYTLTQGIGKEDIAGGPWSAVFKEPETEAFRTVEQPTEPAAAVPGPSSPATSFQTPSAPPSTPAATMNPSPLPSFSPRPSPTAVPGKETDILELYAQTAFEVFSNDPKWDNVIKRWETPIRIEMIGDYTEEDYDAVNDLLVSLYEQVPWLDVAFLEGEGNESGNMVLNFIAQDQMKGILPGASEDNDAYYYLSWNKNAQITKAQLAFAADTISQKERRHFITEYIVHSLGIVGSLSGTPDSILDKDSTAGTLSEVDYILISMHYSAVTYAGQSKQEALEALKTVS